MREEQREFFKIMTEFKRMHISTMLPDINHGDYAILKAIDNGSEPGEGRGTKVSCIARGMDVPMPAVSRGLKLLEHRGFLERTVDREDRRNTYVLLTEKGRKLLNEADEIMTDFADAVLGKMGEENVKRLNQFLRVFLDTSLAEIATRKYKGEKGEAENEENI